MVQADNQAPTANFSSSCSDLDCDFTDQSTDADGNVTGWSWDFDDGNSSSAENPSHSYATAGSYMVMLTVTDNNGAQASTSKSVSVTAPPTVTINVGMSDAWFDPATGGQGFFIIAWEDAQIVFLSWFTFDTERPPEDVMAILGEPGHRWLTAQGPFSGDTAVLDVFLTSGGVFDAADPPATTDQQPIGTITITWSSCAEGVLTYDLPLLGLMGEIPIQRIVPDNAVLCEAGQPES